MQWDYDKEEILADGVVHGLGVLWGLVAVGALLVASASTVPRQEFTAVVVYGGSLLTVLIVSAVYNLWPVSPAKWILRRYDHSAIYLLIAGTYTPFVMKMEAGAQAVALISGVWATCLVGIALKLLLPGRFDRLSICLYLFAGWSGVLSYEATFSVLPESTLWLLVSGGVLYTAGVVFHLWESLRFQNAIWHGFVLAAAACHYGAVLDCIVLAQDHL